MSVAPSPQSFGQAFDTPGCLTGMITPPRTPTRSMSPAGRQTSSSTPRTPPPEMLTLAGRQTSSSSCCTPRAPPPEVEGVFVDMSSGGTASSAVLRSKSPPPDMVSTTASTTTPHPSQRDYFKDEDTDLEQPPRRNSKVKLPNLKLAKEPEAVMYASQGPPQGLSLWRLPMVMLPRKLTAMSFPSDSDVSSNIGIGSNSSGGNGAYLQKCASRISFSSWRSGGSSSVQSKGSSNGSSGKNTSSTENAGFAKTLSKLINRGKQDAYLAEGERRISFDPEDVTSRVQPESLNAAKGGMPNKVHTAKFTPITWLPKSLFMQFQRVANIYFLFIVVLVLFPWSPKDWKSKVFPFTFVLLWTAIKDLHEDSRRRKDDSIENSQKTLTFNITRKDFSQKCWKHIQVGDIVLVECDKQFPADLILMYSGNGLEAYISTISLDGETNLKERRPPGLCKGMRTVFDAAAGNSVSTDSGDTQPTPRSSIEAAKDCCLHLVHHIYAKRFSIRLGRPDVAVQDVKGVISAESHSEAPLALTNYLPRGCVLRNTSWALAIVGYVGDDTKTRLNSSKSKPKVSNMQKYLNMCVWGLLVCLFILCIFAATMRVIQFDEFAFCCDEESFVIRIAVFMITFYHVVPMSLYVCFELLKLVLVFQLNTDSGMADPDTGVFSVARTSDLIEEMGQIDFVFSDKTGTLTKNEMVFAKACIGGQDLGDFRKGVDGREPDTIKRLREGLRNPQNTSVQYWKDVNWFFTCLATCNTVQVAKEKDAREEILIRNDVPSQPSGRSVNPAAKDSNTEISDIPEEIQYLGMSPDEVALVGAAQSVGIVFSSRQHHKSRSSSTASEVCVGYPDATTKTFAVVYELEFTSERKRMSVILRLGSEIILVTKGADSVIEGLLQEPISMAYRDRLNEYSQSGLRTLLVAYKRIDRHAFRKWDKEYKEAQNITDGNKAEQVLRLQAEMETGLKLVGITAVEDCLQDGVPEAIAKIKEAGIRLWVLTGDKTETAVDIARSCYIFTDSTRVAYATGATSEEEAFQKLEIAKDQIEGSNAADAGLVLDGGTLQYCFGSERCKQHILDIGLSSRSCVCCRLNPLQKRNIIDIVQKRDKRIITLAIGDGANDVPMIEGAHLGVGVRGKEGAQAVQVSDVAISQFRFLVPLLLCHGRRAYRRIALFLCYYLYKNVALLMGDVVWMIMDNFRGRIAFPEYVSIQYNVLFTSWHILFVLGFDVDVSDEVATRNPNLYLVGPRRELFNARVFCLWMICGVIHGIVAWTVPALWIIDGAEYDKDSPGKFWEGSITAFTIVILLVSIKLLITCQSPLKIKTSILPTLAAIFCYVVWTAGVVPYVPPLTSWQPSMEGIGTNLAGNTNALISMVAVPAAVTTVDLVIAMVKTRLMPSELDRLRRGQREDQQLKSNVEIDVEV